MSKSSGEKRRKKRKKGCCIIYSYLLSKTTTSLIGLVSGGQGADKRERERYRLSDRDILTDLNRKSGPSLSESSESSVTDNVSVHKMKF